MIKVRIVNEFRIVAIADCKEKTEHQIIPVLYEGRFKSKGCPDVLLILAILNLTMSRFWLDTRTIQRESKVKTSRSDTEILSLSILSTLTMTQL